MVTAAAFGPTGDVIALATAGNHVAMFEAETLQHTPWSLANTARPPPQLLQPLQLLQPMTAGHGGWRAHPLRSAQGAHDSAPLGRPALL